MNPRFQAIATAGRKTVHQLEENSNASSIFGMHVFNRNIMNKMLPKEVYQNIVEAQEGKAKLKPEYADTIALAMKEWAISHGATHYCHWFQPLTGATAEKHDAFIDWQQTDQVIERFSGKQLIQGEPDASSFPSGGLRSTYEARGYTGWDPVCSVFLWKGGDGLTLCIPSVFFSWTGDVLDSKIPFHRSEKKISTAAKRLLTMAGIQVNHVYSTLGCEQEYFIVDRAFRNLRPDLVLIGKTVVGASSPKGQELQDHYFGSVKDRILAYMRDFEIEAFKLGIPLKTRHNEVAPAQHEVAPVFERSSISIDHNILLMEIMRQVANKHELSCLLHEKPFQGINGSGKHCNWSLSADQTINLLDPTDIPGKSIHFLILLTAILHAVHEHAVLLRASIGSPSNDYRLGGHEAPPAIISVYLGQELEQVLEDIEASGSHQKTMSKSKYDLGNLTLPELAKDNTDRNRTSPFAFTGNKFEFRAVGSSANPAFPVTVLNAVVADSLNRILDEIEQHLNSSKNPEDFVKTAVPIIQKYLKASKPIRFSGDNYSHEWYEEAQRRKLPNMKKSIDAFSILKDPKTIEVFKGIFTEQELASRFDILVENYVNIINIEAKILLDLFKTQILPCALSYQKQMAKGLKNLSTLIDTQLIERQKRCLEELTEVIQQALEAADALEDQRLKSSALQGLAEMGRSYSENVLVAMGNLRVFCDKLETIVDDKEWPLPKYRELLFIV